MNKRHQQRLFLGLAAFSALGVALALVLWAMSSHINLFYSPKDLLNEAKQIPMDFMPGRTFRLGGMVKKGSLQYTPPMTVRFEVTDYEVTVEICYTGILPDLFREGQGVVALGHWQAGRFMATEVLAKHDENYMPPEVKKALS